MTKNYYVGLDVHKETIAIAYATGGTRDESVYHGPCGGSVLAAERALRKLAEKLGVEFSALKVCYEAGPTGFVLARRLIRLGLDCVLMSPSKTERKPNETFPKGHRPGPAPLPAQCHRVRCLSEHPDPHHRRRFQLCPLQAPGSSLLH